MTPQASGIRIKSGAQIKRLERFPASRKQKVTLMRTGNPEECTTRRVLNMPQMQGQGQVLSTFRPGKKSCFLRMLPIPIRLRFSSLLAMRPRQAEQTSG